MSVILGDSFFEDKTGLYHSRCKKSSFDPVDSRSLTNLTPETVYDRKTGLIWQRCNQNQDSATCLGTPLTNPDWTNALNYFRDLNLGGRTDWRLPNIKELTSILDFSQSTGAITSQDFFPNTPTSTGHWSSTTFASDVAQTWIVNMDAASFPGFNTGGKSQSNFTKCVAGPEYIPSP
ncbi:MAG: DUF1566 domain-containing protein [Leptospira sp.]|nr:DUF1566 domain-containing protein [Leptospira sp.]